MTAADKPFAKVSEAADAIEHLGSEVDRLYDALKALARPRDDGPLLISDTAYTVVENNHQPTAVDEVSELVKRYELELAAKDAEIYRLASEKTELLNAGLAAQQLVSRHVAELAARDAEIERMSGALKIFATTIPPVAAPTEAKSALGVNDYLTTFAVGLLVLPFFFGG